jgi:hypothetical protein
VYALFVSRYLIAKSSEEKSPWSSPANTSNEKKEKKVFANNFLLLIVLSKD